MTREEAKKKAEIMLAYAEGKEIQWRRGGEWEDLENPGFGCNTDNYRIKPEPHYRPFKNAEEVMEAIKEHGSWVNWKDGSGSNLIVCLSAKAPSLWLGTASEAITFDEAFCDVVFTDGTPFGKLVEEKK